MSEESKDIRWQQRFVNFNKAFQQFAKYVSQVEMNELEDILSARNEISKLSLPYKFDIIIFDRINEEALQEHIERVGIILCKRKSVDIQ